MQENIFLDIGMMGYIAVFMLVLTGFIMNKLNRSLGVLWFVLECLIAYQYFQLLGDEPNYWWHIFILLLGGIITCVFPSDRR
jgi:hypothetical protein